MAEKSNIQWTDATWNIARGCTKVDEDCKYCYMYREAGRYQTYDPLQVTRTKTVFNLPLRIKEPSKIFTSSLTDFFHEAIDSYRNEAWDIIRRCPQHTFQILTKRPERIHDHLPEYWDEIRERCWIGTSAGSGAEPAMTRIKHLMWLKGTGLIKTAFLSLEPLHGEIDIEGEFDLSPMDCGASILDYIDWVIVGGESGNETGKFRYRPCELDWIVAIVSACKEAMVPVFVKQMGTYLATITMGLKDRHGGDISEFPPYLQVREFPTDDFVFNVLKSKP